MYLSEKKKKKKKKKKKFVESIYTYLNIIHKAFLTIWIFFFQRMGNWLRC